MYILQLKLSVQFSTKYLLLKSANDPKISLWQSQGAKTSCMSVCTKRVCVSDNERKACTVGIYST